MKTLVVSSTSDVRHVLHASQLTLQSNGTTDIGYCEHFHVSSMYWTTYILLYLLSNIETLRA
jgi:hypothetical protein